MPAAWRRVRRALRHQRATDGGAHAPALVGPRRDRARSRRRSSPACGGGASTSARSSAASIARKSRPRIESLNTETARLRTEAGDLRARSSHARKRTRHEPRRRRRRDSKQVTELVAENAQLKEAARVPAEAGCRFEQAGRPDDSRGLSVEREGDDGVALQHARRPRRQPAGRISRAMSSLQADLTPATLATTPARCTCPTTSRTVSPALALKFKYYQTS
mgnify:CR=1 FL=1